MKKSISTLMVGLLLLTGCSSGSSELTFTPLFQDQEITVPGVTSECENKERAEEIIRNFYTNDDLVPVEGRFILDAPECFNDALLFDYAYEQSPEAQEQKEAEAKEWVPDGYNVSYQGTQVIEGFANKFLDSGYQCASGSTGCFGVSVISRDGCPSGIFGYMFYTDSSGNQLPEVMETTGRAQAMQPMTLVFNVYDNDIENGRIWKVGCY